MAYEVSQAQALLCAETGASNFIPQFGERMNAANKQDWPCFIVTVSSERAEMDFEVRAASETAAANLVSNLLPTGGSDGCWWLDISARPELR
jgi:hypothetical protein